MVRPPSTRLTDGISVALRPRRPSQHALAANNGELQRLEVLRIEPRPDAFRERFSVRRSIRSMSPHQHCTTTAGALDLNAALGSTRTGRGRSSMVAFGGERRMGERCIGPAFILKRDFPPRFRALAGVVGDDTPPRRRSLPKPSGKSGVLVPVRQHHDKPVHRHGGVPADRLEFARHSLPQAPYLPGTPRRPWRARWRVTGLAGRCPRGRRG
jgi:hypothetical protein